MSHLLIKFDAAQTDWFLGDSTTFVTFIVGTAPNTKNFTVHKEVACFESPVFDHAFNEDVGSSEHESQTFCLENVTARTFQMLVQWMYSKTLNLRQIRRVREEIDDYTYFVSPDAPVSDAVKREEDMTMACLWVLAENLKMPVLQNILIDRIDRITNECHTIPCSTYHYIYRSTKSESLLRKYTMDSAIRYIDVKTLRDREAEIPRPLLVTLGVKMLDLQRKREDNASDGSPLNDEELSACRCLVTRDYHYFVDFQ